MSTATTAIPSPLSSGNVSKNSGKSDGGGQSNSFFTFLATLLLLLCVSAAVVLRSLFLRQRRLQQSNNILPGVVVSSRHQASKKKRYVRKPKMYDVWITNAVEAWDFLMPIAVQAVRRKRQQPRPSTHHEQEKPDYTFFWDRYMHNDPLKPQTIPLPPSEDLVPKILPSRASRLQTFQVAVLVSMPSPLPNDEKLPEINVGTVRLPCYP